MSLKSINPYTGKVIQEYDEHSDAKINDILIKSGDAFAKWKRTDFSARSSVMTKVARLLRDNKKIYAETITLEMGKPINESVAEVEKCAWVCDYYAEKAENFLRADVVGSDADESYVYYEPLGTAKPCNSSNGASATARRWRRVALKAWNRRSPRPNRG
jgi:succinate-semialdehyde dehydrogenase/glutarate-semialdehyde dehydrogenase